jgi:hypothetical protein
MFTLHLSRQLNSEGLKFVRLIFQIPRDLQLVFKSVTRFEVWAKNQNICGITTR